MKTHIRNAAIALMAGAWLVATPLYADMHDKSMEQGMMGKGMMMDAEQPKKMGEMRKQMHRMQKSTASDADAKKRLHLHPRDGK